VRLFLAGFASFLCFFLVSSHPTILVLIGWIAWLSAYFGVLVKYYKRKVPLPTALGWVEREKRPILYTGMYLFFGLAGVFTAVAVSLILTRFQK
jgi:hypothetical protein